MNEFKALHTTFVASVGLIRRAVVGSPWDPVGSAESLMSKGTFLCFCYSRRRRTRYQLASDSVSFLHHSTKSRLIRRRWVFVWDVWTMVEDRGYGITDRTAKNQRRGFSG